MFAAMAATVARDDSVLTHGDAEQALPEEEHAQPPPPVDEEDERKLTVPMKIGWRRWVTAFERGRRIRDPVRMGDGAIKSPGVTDIEGGALMPGNQALAEDVIRYIAATATGPRCTA